jgi:hypothetical protein
MSVLKIKDLNTGKWVNVPLVSYNTSQSNNEIINYVESRFADLDNVLKDILEVLQNEELNSLKTEQIQQIIVSYLEDKKVYEVEE